MKRWQLVELNDLSWWPGVLRPLLTDYLRAVIRINQPFNPKLDLIVDAMRSTGTYRVLDLCSGSGGPWGDLAPELAKRVDEPVEIVLTDKFPYELDEDMKSKGVTYSDRSIDAASVPDDETGVRTIFNGFHHFPPELATKILQDAVKKKQPIVVFELLQRTYLDLLIMLAVPLFVLLMTPSIRPFRWSRIFFTYLVPIAPFTIFFDSFVSALRCYTVDELLEMGRGVDNESYRWTAGAYRHQGLPVTYLAGVPNH